MNDVAQLHPEDLLDRHYAGTLSAVERRRLDAHLEACATCRLEVALGEDLDAEQQEQEPDLSHLVLGAVPVPERSRLPGARWLWVLAAVVVTGSAGAAYLGARAGSSPHESPSDSPAVAPTIEPGPAPAAREPSPERDEPEADMSEVPASPSAAAPSAETAASLFSSANAARRAGRGTEALRRYEQLQTRFPESREARTSRAIVAELMLEEDPSAAASAYDDYLDEGGRLGEEALVGRAEALREAGRHAEEAASWRELLARYPESLHAGRARARLAAIGATPPSPDASQK